MTVEVISVGPPMSAHCGRCRSHIQFEAKDAGFLALKWAPPGVGTFRINCPVCKADVFKTVKSEAA